MQFPKWKLLALIVYVSGLSLSLVGYAITSINLSRQHILNFVNNSNVFRRREPFTTSHQSIFYSALATAVIFAAIPTTLIAPWFMNRFGRKFVLCFMHAPLSVLASGLMIMANFVHSYEVLLVGRVFVGLSAGFAYPAMAVYATECSPGKFRGLLGSVPIVMLTIGAAVGTVINAPFCLGTKILWIFGQSAPSLFVSLTLICSYPWIPESPKYSLHIGDIEGAKRMIREYHGVEASDESMSEMRRELISSKVKWIGFRGAFQHYAIRRAIFLGFVANTTVGTSGLVTFQVYSETALVAAGAGGDQLVGIVIGMQVLVVIATAIAALIIHKLDRRTALLSSSFVCAVLVGVMSAIAFVQKSFPYLEIGQHLGITQVVLKAVLFAVSPIGPGCIPLFLPSELSTTAYRPLVSSLSLLGQYIAGVATVMLFPVLTKKIGSGFTYLSLFAAPLLIAGIFLCLKMPETKVRHVDEIVAQLGGQKVNEVSTIIDILEPDNKDVTNGDRKKPREQFQMRGRTGLREKAKAFHTTPGSKMVRGKGRMD